MLKCGVFGRIIIFNFFMSVFFYIYIVLFGKKVASDRFGNKYYIVFLDMFFLKIEKRYVLYNGIKDPSKIPPDYSSWLMGNVDDIFTLQTRTWVKEHLPNLSGTKLAYQPKNEGSETRKQQAWKPKHKEDI